MPWISKKAKAQMRVRRKRKEKKSFTYSATAVTIKNISGGDGDAISQNHDDHNKKRKLSDGNPAAGSSTENGKSSNWDNIQKDTSICVTVPSTLSSKEAKKLRKDVRRQARKEARDESLIKFVDENGNPINEAGSSTTEADKNIESNNESNHDDNDDNNDNHIKKRRKVTRSFPKINEILAEAKAAKKEEEEKDKRTSYENSVPDEIKAKYVSLDCEMVGIGAEGKQSALARVSITDWHGNIVIDTFVQVPDRVTDFRTFVSGVRAKDINITNSNAMELHACRRKVGEILKNKILVGHSLKNDFAALMLGHPKHQIRDTAKYKPFMRASGRNGGKMRPRKLRDLVKEQVGLIIQKEGEAHTSVEDATAAMELYKAVREQWEKDIEKAAKKR